MVSAFQFLRDSSNKYFVKYDGTIAYLRIVDELFDFVNLRNPCGRGLKNPLYFDKLSSVERLLTPIVEYLFTLKDKGGQPLYKARRKTFF